MKKIVIVILIFILLTVTCGCQQPEEEVLVPSFTPYAYTKAPVETVVTLTMYYGSKQEAFFLQKVVCSESDPHRWAIERLLNMSYTDAVEHKQPFASVACLDVQLLNNIMFVNFDYSFMLLDDSTKAMLVTSLMDTLASFSQFDHLMVYACNKAAFFTTAPDISITPLEPDVLLYPALLLQNCLDSQKLLDNRDDFTLPALLWLQDLRGNTVPCVRNIAMEKSFAYSTFIALCSSFGDGFFGMYNGSTIMIEPPKYNVQDNQIRIKLLGKSDNVNTDMLLLSLFPYTDSLLVWLDFYELSTENIQVYKESVQVHSRKKGIATILQYHQPSGKVLTVKPTAVTIQNKNVLLTATDYCLRQGLEQYGVEFAPDITLLYDVWMNGTEICVSISQLCKALFDYLPEKDAQLVVFSLVNTLTSTFRADTVRILLDGCTSDFLNCVNIEQPLFFADIYNNES